MDDSKQNTDLDWENRLLCSDESCIGVIGPDGRCKECGLPYQGELPQMLTDSAEVEAQAPPAMDGAEPDEEAADPDQDLEDNAADFDSDDEWARRKLCRDESCIGVIGPDGRCKECGKTL